MIDAVMRMHALLCYNKSYPLRWAHYKMSLKKEDQPRVDGGWKTDRGIDATVASSKHR